MNNNFLPYQLKKNAEQASNLATQLAQNASQLKNIPIDICNPPSSTGLSSVKGDGTDNNGDTQRLQAIINYAIANDRDVYVPKNLTLVPQLQSDGSYVCLVFDDGATSGNYRRGIRFYSKQSVVITTTDNVHNHTIIRWKLSQSLLDGFIFNGVQSKTKGLELSRINLTNVSEFDGCSRNKFTNLRFLSMNYGITLEGSSYYNQFENISMMTVNTGIWLKPTYAMINNLVTNDSGVNRNNFYNISVFGSTNGILVDMGDTNKFYSCSFESLSGTAVQVNEITTTYPSAVENTYYNTFYGTTCENCNINLINNAKGNSFIDFEGSTSKVTFNQRPTIYIPCGDTTANHLYLQSFVQTIDANSMKYIKNRAYMDNPLYTNNMADYNGTDSNGLLRGFNWRQFPFTVSQCTNISSFKYNNSVQGAFKSIGGIVYYTVKISIQATNATQSVKIPLPELTPSNDLFSYGNNPSSVIPIGYNDFSKGTLLLPAILDTTGITIPPPSGGWNTTVSDSANVLLINIHYPRDLWSMGMGQDTN